MGTTANAIPVRLARGEPDDVLIMVGYALDSLLKDGRAAAGSKVDVALSPIGMAVKAGAPVPDISTLDKLRAVLLAASSIAYSDSASGVYIESEMFKKLGIEDQVKGKAHMIPATPVGEIVAQGEAELGFQQVAELLPVPGITFAGRLPPEVQQVTVYSAGIAANAKQPEAGAQADPVSRLGAGRPGRREERPPARQVGTGDAHGVGRLHPGPGKPRWHRNRTRESWTWCARTTDGRPCWRSASPRWAS